MWKIVGVGTLVGIAVAGYVLLGSSTYSETRSKVSTNLPVENNEGNSNDVLLSAIEDLGRRISRLDDRMDQFEDKPDSVDDFDKEERPDEIDAFDQAVNARAEAIAKTAEYDRFLAEEQRDSTWATESEDHIQTVFDQGNFEGSELHDVECKRTFCRVQASHDDENSSSDFELIKRKMPGSYIIQRLEDDANGRKRTLAYFMREGEDMNNPIFMDMMAQRKSGDRAR